MQKFDVFFFTINHRERKQASPWNGFNIDFCMGLSERGTLRSKWWEFTIQAIKTTPKIPGSLSQIGPKNLETRAVKGKIKSIVEAWYDKNSKTKYVGLAQNEPPNSSPTQNSTPKI